MDYTEMLKQEFVDRKARRPAYSERAFARDLKISPGYISLLFRGQRALSPAKGLALAQRLGWTEEKTNHFVAAIQKNSLLASPAARSEPGKKPAKFVELELDQFRFIADLHHLAALAIFQSRDGQDAASVSEKLGIALVEAELVVGRLLRLGLIRPDGKKFTNTKKSLEIKTAPSEAIRSFHRQAIQRAEEAIEGQPAGLRNLGGLTLSFDVEKLAEAKVFIHRFLKSFEKKFGNAPKGEIYQMNTQFFNLKRNGR